MDLSYFIRYPSTTIGLPFGSIKRLWCWHAKESCEVSYSRVVSFVHLDRHEKVYLNVNIRTKSQLLYTDNQYTNYSRYQQFLYELCTTLKDKGLGYRKISYYLNRRGYKTSYSKKMFTNGHVSSILKKGKVREDRIKSLKSHKDYGYTFETELSTS